MDYAIKVTKGENVKAELFSFPEEAVNRYKELTA